LIIQERHERFMRRRFLEEEIKDLETQIEPHDTGHIHTTISTLKHQYKTLTGFDYGDHPNATTVEAPHPNSKIYESPDGGKTVYERPFGAPHTERTLVRIPDTPFEEEDEDWNGYDDHEFEFDDIEELLYKYNEEELINEFATYINSTYDQHYSQNKYQATEIAIEAGHGTGFCIGNILKYAQRYGRKGTAANARKDLLKIMHYALIQLYIHDTES